MFTSITKKELLQTLFEKWRIPRRVEQIMVSDALGRVAAEDVRSLVSLPVCRAAQMDSVAVRSKDFLEGVPDAKGWVLGRDYAFADMGDDFPDAFDAAVPVEDVMFDRDGNVSFEPGLEVRPGFGVKRAGSTVATGSLLVERGTLLRPFDIASIQLGGVERVSVLKAPVVTFIPTGSELIPPGSALARGKCFDVNSAMAYGMLMELGAEVRLLPIVRDMRCELAEVLEAALLDSDIVLLNGGSSKGEADLNARLLDEFAEVLCHGVAAAPGRPLCLALSRGGTPIVNVPGPPVALLHCFEWCVRPIVSHFLGIPTPMRPTVRARLDKALDFSGQMELLCFLKVSSSDSGYLADPVSFKDVELPEALRTGAYFLSELGRTRYDVGEEVDAVLLRGYTT